MENLQLSNILITFITDNENIIGDLEQDLEELVEEQECHRENLECEITDRSNMVSNAKIFLKEIND